MNYCTKCGATIEDGVKFCTECGTVVEETLEATSELELESEDMHVDSKIAETDHEVVGEEVETTELELASEPIPQPTPQLVSEPQNPYTQSRQPKEVTVNTTPYIIWSIINIVICCMPLGIAGLIVTLQANSAKTQEAADKAIKNATIINSIGTVSLFVFMFVYFMFIVLMAI